MESMLTCSANMDRLHSERGMLQHRSLSNWYFKAYIFIKFYLLSLFHWEFPYISHEHQTTSRSESDGYVILLRQEKMSGMSSCVCSAWLNAGEAGTLSNQSLLVGMYIIPFFCNTQAMNIRFYNCVISEGMLVDDVARLEDGTRGRKDSWPVVFADSCVVGTPNSVTSPKARLGGRLAFLASCRW